MPDEPSPYQKDEGVPCVMFSSRWIWRKKFTLDLMAPIAEDLAERGSQHGTSNTVVGSLVMKVCGWNTLGRNATGVNWLYCRD